MREDGLGFGHTTGTAALTNRQGAIVRIEHVVADLPGGGGIAAYRRMRPHAIVHRRDQQRRCRGRQEAGREQIIGVTTNRASQKISGRRCDHHQLGRAGECDVIQCTPRRNERRVHRASRERLERDRANELCRGPC